MRSVLFIVLCLATCVHAVELRGKIVGVSDGDTVTVLDAERHQHKVRLAGIDAREKAQPFGQASKISLADQIFWPRGGDDLGQAGSLRPDHRQDFGRSSGRLP